MSAAGSICEARNVTALPDNLTVGGFLDLRDTGVTKLPDNLKVGGNLYLQGTGVTELPDNLKVGGKVCGFNPPPREEIGNPRQGPKLHRHGL